MTGSMHHKQHSARAAEGNVDSQAAQAVAAAGDERRPGVEAQVGQPHHVRVRLEPAGCRELQLSTAIRDYLSAADDSHRRVVATGLALHADHLSCCIAR